MSLNFLCLLLFVRCIWYQYHEPDINLTVRKWSGKRQVGCQAGANKGAGPRRHAGPPLNPLPSKNCNTHPTKLEWWGRRCRGWMAGGGGCGGRAQSSPLLSLESVVEDWPFLDVQCPKKTSLPLKVEARTFSKDLRCPQKCRCVSAACVGGVISLLLIYAQDMYKISYLLWEKTFPQTSKVCFLENIF